VLRAGVGLRQAFSVALAADTVSIAVMELLDNAVVVAVPGAMDSGVTNELFWGSLALILCRRIPADHPGQPVDDRVGQGPCRRTRLPPLTVVMIAVWVL
jgi:hypothetical protein